MKLLKSLLLIGVASLVCRDASAQAVYSVNAVGVYQILFPPGTQLVGQTETNGMTWAAAGPDGPQITIAANSLTVPGLAAPAGNKARLAGVNGPAARIGLGTNLTSGTVYYSLALRVADHGTLGTNGGTLAAFNNATGASSNLPAPLATLLLIRASGSNYQLGLSPTAGSFYSPWTGIVFQTVFVVASYTFIPGLSNDVARMWVNPDPATFGVSNAPPPNLTVTSSNDVDQISSFVLMQRPQPILPAVTFVDEIRVGTSWASVTPPLLGQVCTDFAQGLPVGTTAAGTPPPYVADGVLHLTDATNDQAGYWSSPLPWQNIESFSASWRTLIGGGGDPNNGSFGAEGLSFSLGMDPGTTFVPEEGAGNGLNLGFDTFDGGFADEVGLEIKWSGQRVAFTRSGDGQNSGSAKAPLRRNEFVDTSVEVTPSGLTTFRYGDLSVSGQLPDYTGIQANQLVFAARTSDAYDNHWIDDFCLRLNSFIYEGLRHELLGGAGVTWEPDHIRVTDFGASGEDGFRIELGRVEGWMYSMFGPGGFVCAESNSSAGGYLTTKAYGKIGGQENQLLYTSTERCTAAGLEASIDFSPLGTSGALVQLFDRDHQLVGERNLATGEIVLITDDDPNWGRSGVISWTIDPATPVQVHPAGGNVVSNVSFIEFSPSAPLPTPEYLSSLSFTGTGLDSFRVVDEWVMRSNVWFRALGSARIESSNELRFTGLASTGANGLSVLPPEPVMDASLGSIALDLLPIDLAAPDAELKVALAGTANELHQQELGALTLSTVIGGFVRVAASFPLLESPNVRIEVFNNDAPVGSAIVPAGNLGDLVGSNGLSVVQIVARDPAAFEVRFVSPFGLTLAQATGDQPNSLYGTRFLISAVSAPGVALFPSQFHLTSARIPAIAIRGATYIPVSSVAPSVVLTSPANGGSFPIGTPVTLSATASADGGKSIVNVEFFDRSNSVGQDTLRPYTITLSNLAPGAHVLSAVATDNAWLSTTSAAVTILVSGSESNAPGDLDFSFDPGSSIRGGVQPVLAIALQPDGKAVIGGEFVTVHDAMRNRIARLNADGGTDFEFLDQLAGADNKVQAVAVQSDGGILLAGWFLNVNGVARSKIARLDRYGGLDRSFQEGMSGVTGGALTAVHAMLVQPDGKILIAGDFTSVNDTNRSHVARLNGDGSVDTSFHDPAVNGLVFALALAPDGKIYIGGNFGSVAETSRPRIARLNSNGALDTNFDPLAGADNTVTAIVVGLDNRPYLGGAFENVNGVPRRKVARLLSSGAVDMTFSDVNLNGGVNCMVLQPDGQLLVGGGFSYYTTGLVLHGGFARFYSDGTRDVSFDDGKAGANNPVDALALLPSGQMLVGGRFTEINGRPRIGIALINTDGTLSYEHQNGPQGPDDLVRSISAQPDGSVMVGGQFHFYDNWTLYRGLARLSNNGSLDLTFAKGANSGLNGGVFATVSQPDGKTVIVGDFFQIDGTNRTYIARLDSNGRLDTTFGYSGSGASGPPQAVALQSNGMILVGGSFSAVNGTNRNGVARLTADGLIDPTFSVGSGPNALVTSLAVQEDGKILVGGWFTTFAGETRNRVARLLPNGDLDPSFQNGLAGADNRIYAVAVQPDQKIIVAGEFTSFNGTPRSRMVRLNPDGTIDNPFEDDMPIMFNGPILAVRLQADGGILIGGAFTSIDGVQRNRIARLHANGPLDLTFMNGSGANDEVWAIDLDAAGNVYLGGRFTLVNGSSCDRIARVFGSTTIYDVTPPIINCPTGVAATATTSSGAIVNFTVTATDAVDSSPFVLCTPPSGSVFAMGTTQVSCIATDASGNTSGCTFPVSVSALVFFGSEHVPFGAATLSLGSNGLRISNLGWCGQDGVRIELHELSRTASLNFGSNGFALLDSGKLTLAAYGTVSNTPGQFLGSVSFANSNGVVSGFWDMGPLLWFQSRRIEVYNASTLVGTYPVPQDGSVGTLSGDVRLKTMSFVAEPGQDSFIEWEWVLWVYTPPGQSNSVTGNRLRLVYVGSSNKIDNLARVVLSGCNIDSLLIADETAPRFQPELRTELTGGTLNITWDTRSAVLQTAPTISGPWTDVAEGTNRVQVVPSGGAGFFRVLVKPLNSP